jgi:hypothetical protein
MQMTRLLDSLPDTAFMMSTLVEITKRHSEQSLIKSLQTQTLPTQKTSGAKHLPAEEATEATELLPRTSRKG